MFHFRLPFQEPCLEPPMDGLPFGEIAEEREAQAQHGFSDQKSIKHISKHQRLI